jgi:hypothetical protein
MKMVCLVAFAMSMAACGDGLFRSRPVTSNLVGNVESASSGVDAADSGSSSQVDGANSGQKANSADGKAKSAADVAAAAEREKQLANLDPAAVAAAERCPGLDPVLIDKLIKSGQPFEVECEVEVEVGPDTD